MSINSDTSRSVREEAHQKLDALLYSISSRQLERVYGITSATEKDSDAAPSATVPLPTPQASDSTPAVALSHHSGIKRHRERTPPTVRWEDEPNSEHEDDLIKDSESTARRLSFPPMDNFRNKIEHLKQKQKRAENLTAIAASMDERLLGRDEEDDGRDEREKLTPYVDALLNYVHFLEAERVGFAGEMEKLRQNVAVVAKENTHLHKEMKRGFLEAVVAGGKSDGVEDYDAVAPPEDAIEAMRSEIENIEKRHVLEIKRWKIKAETTDREKEEILKKLETLEKEEEERRSGEWKESGGAEAKRIAESLLSERNELSNSVMELSRKLTEAKSREEEVTSKLKKTLLVADQSLFEKDEMTMREEKTRRELEEEKKRWVEEKTRMEEERKVEAEKMIWEAGSKISSLEEALREAEADVIRAKERVATVERKRVEEEEERRKDRGKDEEENIVINPSLREGNVQECEKETMFSLPKSKSSDLELSQLKQMEARLRQEMANYESKTRCLEIELTESRDECVKLHERVAEVEREASLAKLKRETMAKFRFEDAKEAREDADLRAEELRKVADEWKQKYVVDVTELKSFAGLQADLITKLKEECVSLTSSLETISAQLTAESHSRSSECEQKDKLLAEQSDQLRREKQKTKKNADSVRKLKGDVFRLTSLADERKAKILEMTDAVAKAIADRQMQAKENDFLRQIHLPTATSQPFLLRSHSPASARSTDQLATPRLSANFLMTAPGPSTVASTNLLPAVPPTSNPPLSPVTHNP